MKILRLSQLGASPCGQLVLSSLLGGTLPQSHLDGYIISLRDEHLAHLLPSPEGGRPDSYTKTFVFGEAIAIITQAMDSPESGRRIVKVTIESHNVSDFAAIFMHVYRDWLHIPHEEIPVPKYRLQELSFVRGIRNDLRDLRKFCASLWHRTRAKAC